MDAHTITYTLGLVHTGSDETLLVAIYLFFLYRTQWYFKIRSKKMFTREAATSERWMFDTQTNDLHIDTLSCYFLQQLSLPMCTNWRSILRELNACRFPCEQALIHIFFAVSHAKQQYFFKCRNLHHLWWWHRLRDVVRPPPYLASIYQTKGCNCLSKRRKAPSPHVILRRQHYANYQTYFRRYWCIFITSILDYFAILVCYRSDVIFTYVTDVVTKNFFVIITKLKVFDLQIRKTKIYFATSKTVTM